MGWLHGVVVAYSLLCIGGGIAGYAAGSPVSLYSGGGVGILLLGAAALAVSKPTIGFGIATLLTLATLGMFIRRGSQMGFVIWPGMIMIGASAIVLICLVVGHFLSKQPSAPPSLP